ncbi:MAG: orotate phosphoribosyltransferase [Candidatus Saganbacteria bacterium]|nr:orotate phosphoribosyltransferase [Candidatus Saganbacteria bacterium]
MDKKAALKKLLKQNAVKTGEFTLSSGGKSNFYVDGKQITLHPEGLSLVAEIILDKIKDCKAIGIGGMTIGADPIAAAVAVLSAKTGDSIPAFIVRKVQKEHGLQKKIEGIIKPGSNVIIVDDVITKGTATLGAIAAVEEIGCKVVKVICLVDRQEGGAEALQEYDFDPIFRKEELI